jgi:hypothetical protein
MKESWFYNEEREEVRVVRIVLAIFALIIFVGAISWTLQMMTRPARTVSEITERTFNGNNVIFNYELFHDRYETIKATKGKIKNMNDSFVALKESLPKDSDKWNYDQRMQYENMNNALVGLKNVLQDQVAEYNADAKKINRNIFKSKDLPTRISVDD